MENSFKLCLMFLLTLGVFTLVSAQKASDYDRCGVSDHPLRGNAANPGNRSAACYQNVLGAIDPNWRQSYTQAELEGPHYIPIKFHVISDGVEVNFTETKSDFWIQKANKHFEDGGFIVTKCAPNNVVVAPELLDLDIGGCNGLHEELDFFALSPPLDNVVNVYVANSIEEGPGSSPNCTGLAGALRNGVILIAKDAHKTTFSHEIGHFLGLVHTHRRKITNTLNDSQFMHIAIDELVLRADYDPLHPVYKWRNNRLWCSNDNPYSSYGNPDMSAGDHIEDTHADPDLSGRVNQNCEYTGDVVDLRDEEYTPDVNNLMSYARNSCRTKFTEGQFDRMLYFYLTDYNLNTAACLPTTPLTEEVRRLITGTQGINNVTVQMDYHHSDNCDPGASNQQGDCSPDPTDNNGIFNCEIPLTGSFKYNLSKPVAVWAEGITDVDFGDIDLIGKFITGQGPLNGHQQIAADINLSGHISVFDIIYIRKFLLGIRTTPEEIPNGELIAPEWRFYSETIAGSNPIHFNSNFNNEPGPFDIGGVYVYPAYLSSELLGTSSFCLDASLHADDLLGFHGVKVGDVDGSIALPNFKSNDSPSDRSESQLLTTINKQMIPQGSRVKLAVRGRNFKEISTFQMGLKLQSEQIEVTNIESAKLPEFSKDAYNLDYHIKGVYPIVWFTLQPEGASIYDNENILILDLIAKKDISSIDELVSLAGNDFKTGFLSSGEGVNVELFSEILEIQSPDLQEWSFAVTHYPDPVQKQVIFNFNLQKSTSLNLYIYDVYGRLMNIQTLKGQIGKNEFVLDTEKENLSGGILFYTIEGEGLKATGKFIKSE